MPDPVVRYWAVVPAGGSGSRMGASLPKQYLELAGLTLLEHSVRAMIRAPWIERAIVVCAPHDNRARSIVGGLARAEVVARGGATRRDSVLAGLQFLREDLGAAGDDWVLVHDAARPALRLAELDRLKTEVVAAGCGGLLATPVADTVKRERGASQTVGDTLDRRGLWLAQTPQMFRLGVLITALEHHPGVTDEAAAIEAEGLPVRLVQGDFANFKVTTPNDLRVMSLLLEHRG